MKAINSLKNFLLHAGNLSNIKVLFYLKTNLLTLNN
jgi:hypothetical protein